MAVAPVPGIKDRYSYGELARLVIWAGFRGTNAAIAVAVIMAESGGRRLARHVVGNEGGRAAGSVDRGLMQINSYWHPEVSNKCAYNPYCNVRQGYRIAGNGRNFRPWSTYNSGAYKRYFAAAAEAVAGAPGAGATGLPGPPPPPTSKPRSLHDAIRIAIDNLPGVPGFLARILADVLEPPIQFAMDIAHLATHSLGKILHTAIIHVKWAIDALRHQAAGIVRWTGRQIIHLSKWVLHLLGQTRKWTLGSLAKLRAWVGHTFGGWLTFANKARSWIALMVRYPYTALLGTWRDLARKAPRVIVEAIISAALKESDLVERFIVRYLGGR